VKELRRFLSERGVDSSSIVEKQELVDAVSAAGTALHNVLVQAFNIIIIIKIPH
jgi:hypothetical protein